MTVNYTTLLGLAKPVTGTEAGDWGEIVNDEITELLEDAVAATATLDVTSGNVTLTDTQGQSDQARCAIIRVTGTPGTTRNVVAPNRSKTYVVVNDSDGSVVIKASATTGATISAGVNAVVVWNGSDYAVVASSSVAGAVTSVTAASPLASTGGTTPQISIGSTIPYNLGGTGQSSYTAGDILYALGQQRAVKVSYRQQWASVGNYRWVAGMAISRSCRHSYIGSLVWPQQLCVPDQWVSCDQLWHSDHGLHGRCGQLTVRLGG